METKFAPAERAPELEVVNLYELLSGVPLLDEILGSVPDVLLFLNEQRQIVFANRATFCLLGIEPTTDVLGSRPGEALGCLHAAETPGGCGTTESCQTCGAVQAILAAQQGGPDSRECRMAIGDSFDANDRTDDYFPGDFFEDGVNIAVTGAHVMTLAGRKTTCAVTGLYSTAEGVDHSSVGSMVGTSAESGASNIDFEFKHNLQESSAPLDRSARQEIVPFTTTTSP